MRIRQGNDFLFLWTIVRNGIPEDLGSAKNIRLHFKNYDCVGEVKSFQIVDGNIVRVEVAPEWASRLGAYRLILSYEFENHSYSDGDRKCVVDVLAFNIVPKTSEADDLTEVTKTTDIMIGFFGLSAYEVWLKDNPDSTKEDYYNWLRQPATDAVSLIDDKIEHLDEVIDSSTANEAERVGAENIRLSNEIGRVNAETQRETNEAERLANEASRVSDELIRETNESTREQDEAIRKTNEIEREIAETTRVSNENNRVTAEQERVDAESSRESAESLRVEAELLRQSSTQEAIGNAENATENANTAAQNADDARLAIQDDLDQLAGDVTRLATISIRNMIKNGNFANGTENWTGNYPTSVSGNVLSVTGNNLYKYSGTQQVNVPFRYDTGRKIYVKASMRVTNSAASSITLFLRNGDGLYATSRVINSPVENKWYTIEEIITLGTITVPTDNMHFEIRQEYADKATASGKVMEVKEVMAIDVLESLSENTTLSDIQGYLVDYPNGWFDGSHILKDVPTIYKELDEIRLNNDNELNKLRLDATISIENKIKNGDFSDGDHQWVMSLINVSATVVDNVLQIKNKGVSYNTNTRQDIGIEYIRNQSVYCRATVRVRDSLCNSIQLGYSNADGNYATYQSVNTPTADEWYTIEGIFTVNNDYSTLQSRVIIRAMYSSTSDALDKILEIKNVIALDISDFGSEMTLSDVQTFLASYPNSWFDGAVTLKTLSNVYNELIDKIGEGGGSAFLKKQPIGLLDDWKLIPDTNGTLGTTRALGYDGYLYYLRGLRIRRLTDVLTGANDIGIPWTLPYPRFICVFPSGIVYVINDTDEEEVKTVKVWKAPDIHTEPTLVATLAGGHTESLACNSFYDGINELVMIGGYEQTKGLDRFMYLSTDGGETFTNVKTTIGVNADYNWHWHAAAYDPYQGRLWISEGDDPTNRAIWYSENMGVSWSRIQSNDYQPTLIMPFPNKVIFGRDHGYPGIDAYIRQKISSEIMPVSVLQDNLTFRKDIAGALYYPSQPQAQEGVEAYISFGAHIAGEINYIYATGDGAESWHCVYSSVNGLSRPLIVGDYIVAHAGSWGDTAMYYTPKLRWE